MKRTVLVSLILASVVMQGCASPHQNAVLAGAAVGAVVGGAIYHANHPPAPVVVRPLRCTMNRGNIIGRDVYGQPVFEYYQVCR